MRLASITRLLCIVSIWVLPLYAKDAPQVAIIFIIDQLPYRTFYNLKPHFKEGLGFLLDKGISYTEARFPHAITNTAPGHAALSTGAFPKDHGIINNYWYDKSGQKKIYSTEDGIKDAAVYSPNGFYEFGRSAKNIVIDGISDQFMLQGSSSGVEAFALSFKDRASICLANKLGKAIWYDDRAGAFTSSKAYYKKFPSWVRAFNGTHRVKEEGPLTWSLAYPHESEAYQVPHRIKDEYARFGISMRNDTITLTGKDGTTINDIGYFPQANQLVLDLAKACIEEHFINQKTKKMLLWISLSSLDKIGHIVGPDNLAFIDTLYHIDKQIGDFINFVENHIDRDKILYGLTADHGVMPIIEHVTNRGLGTKRINAKQLTGQMNEMVSQHHGINNLITRYKAPQFYFNSIIWKKVTRDEKRKIISSLKTFLRNQPGIKNAWGSQELAKTPLEKNSLESLYKTQLYPTRSGQLTCMLNPYTNIGYHNKGASHSSGPYDYNTHVPLILYNKGSIEDKQINKRVSLLQFANTVAKILNIPGPSASTHPVLPGLD